ncbi:hypothetical protein FVE85_9425 [Porphyridium purpureum]|uniref:Uncharacterized protein n=1 Tax=Porphyridium purpureum TaxID=35688 RepID=A0A5J4YIJ6_PORPP|nr:hypothetical protein FVE85_9425 [Porphyridium purpureum]|eukprot:POR4458..scf269_36
MAPCVRYHTAPEKETAVEVCHVSSSTRFKWRHNGRNTEPHERLLAVEEACEGGVDDLPVEVAVAVPVDAGELVCAARREQPFQRALRDGVSAREHERKALCGGRRADRLRWRWCDERGAPELRRVVLHLLDCEIVTER